VQEGAMYHEDVANIFAGLDIDIDATDEFGQTVVHMAALMGRDEMLRALVAKGANINARDRWGNTPLHKAAFRGFASTVELLLHAGAAAGAKNDEGRTPADEARRNRKADVAETIDKRA
ncbi:ankyrin repeat domain-containing protein, partial [bacterium]|nr:ankyrin repeat domain-containing protein [bacterium]